MYIRIIIMYRLDLRQGYNATALPFTMYLLAFSMLNTVLCYATQDTLGAVGQHKEEWQSLLSTFGLNDFQAAKIVESCSSEP